MTLPRQTGGHGAHPAFEIRHLKFIRAFTLVEMILAIGVAAIALVAVHAVLFSALHLRSVTADVVDAATPVDSAVTFLRRDLECVVTTTNTSTTGAILAGSFKTGNVNSYGLAAPVAAEIYTTTGTEGDNTPGADIQRVTYGLRVAADGSGRRDLYRSVTRNLLALTTPDVSDQLLLRGVDSVNFSCFDGTQWQPTWDTTSINTVNTNLPLAVRVDIQLAGANANEPVELVVPIDATVLTNMVLSSSTGTGSTAQ